MIRAGRGDQSGGVIRLVGDGGDTFNSGTLTATSSDGHGGNIDVLGDRVALTSNTLIDVSGKTGGGQVRIGGDYQGGNPDVANATDTYVGADVEIKADAAQQGNGGQVIVWADNNTRYMGSISARGIGDAGNRGCAGVSGRQGLRYRGDVDWSAATGTTG